MFANITRTGQMDRNPTFRIRGKTSHILSTHGVTAENSLHNGRKKSDKRLAFKHQGNGRYIVQRNGVIKCHLSRRSQRQVPDISVGM